MEGENFSIGQLDKDFGLSEGWTIGTLQDLIGQEGILTDGDWVESKDQDPYGDTRLVQLADIGDGFFKNRSQRFLTSEKAKELNCTFLKPGDVLVARMPEPLGRACLFPGDQKPSVTAVDICIIRTGKDGPNNHWIMHTINSPEIRRRIEALHRGTTRKRISRRNLASLRLPIPPLNEQKRIVAKVEELLAQVGATKERLTKVSFILKRLRQAVLAAACSGRLTADWREKHLDVEPATGLLKRIQQDRKKIKKSHINRVRWEENIYFDIPDSWSYCFFEDICSNKPHAIKAGPFGSSLTKSCYTPSGYKIYGQEQVIKGDATYGDYYIDEKKFLELKSCEVEARDLLISLVGTIGRVLIIPDKFEKGIINPRLVKISLHSEIFPEYIGKYLGSPLAINMFERDSHGGTMEILNLKMLKGLPIPLPPVIEQHEIVRRVEAMFKLAEAVEKRAEAAKVRAEKLTQAILAKAFRGELVLTEAELARQEGRSYESASELLSRIKSDQDAKVTSKTTCRGKLFKKKINPKG